MPFVRPPCTGFTQSTFSMVMPSLYGFKSFSEFRILFSPSGNNLEYHILCFLVEYAQIITSASVSMAILGRSIKVFLAAASFFVLKLHASKSSSDEFWRFVLHVTQTLKSITASSISPVFTDIATPTPCEDFNPR